MASCSLGFELILHLVHSTINIGSNVRGSICFAHIRFRRAWVAQGHSVDDLAFKAAAGVWGSWVGLALNILCLVAQFYIAIFPIGGTPNAQSFFEAYLAVPIVIVFYIFWKIYKKTRWVGTMEMDLVSGRREMNLHELRQQEIEERQTWGTFKRYDNRNFLSNIRVYFWLC